MLRSDYALIVFMRMLIETSSYLTTGSSQNQQVFKLLRDCFLPHVHAKLHILPKPPIRMHFPEKNKRNLYCARCLSNSRHSAVFQDDIINS